MNRGIGRYTCQPCPAVVSTADLMKLFPCIECAFPELILLRVRAHFVSLLQPEM